ncbi:unnamed protein product [Kluyveromyces dobzhanskii CBS 2104]|uniref:D-lactate dehydratase n=1 Tax=Kluyveromyces dobzhanskii CBS 2104 TaxID=1427455 RepID=A0A0A8L5M3_9SACH|nr:unnamed protein product [Kluyveromyces dobzhanskii CBS 2104]
MVKALIALTSYNEKFYPDGAKTGVFSIEALHPFNYYKSEGYEVDFVSENGKFGFDEHSLIPDFLSGQDKVDFEDKNSAFNKALARIKSASEVDSSEYQIFFAAGGYGTLFDYPKATGLQKIASQIYAKNGVVAAVCNGPTIFDGLSDETNGNPLIQDKDITGFTEIGADMLGVSTIMRDANVVSVEHIARKHNAKYIAPIGPWDDFCIADGRVVTGVNPASSTSTAKRTVQVLQADK